MQQASQSAIPASYWTDERIQALRFSADENRGHAQRSVTLLPNSKDLNAALPEINTIEYSPEEEIYFEQEVKSGRPLLIHLSLQSLERLAFDLLPFYGVACPAAIVMERDRAPHRILRGTLETIGLLQPPAPHPSIYVLIG